MSWIPLHEREEWKDIQPTPIDEGENTVANIAYTSQFREIMSYFRTILEKDEHSQRAFDLTGEVIDQNSANYTVWYFRRLLLRDPAVKTDWKDELQFCSSLAEDNPKNYQLWHHRRLCVEEIGQTDVAEEDMSFVAHLLEDDNKNYHAWKHRQAIILKFELFEAEWAFVDHMISLDVRNNSAWNQRMFLLNHTEEKPLPHSRVQDEVKYALDSIRVAPDNESPWLFLRGLCLPPNQQKMSDFQEITELCNDILDGVEPLLFTQALMCLYDMAVEKHDIQSANDGLRRLMEVDVTRKRYWESLLE